MINQAELILRNQELEKQLDQSDREKQILLAEKAQWEQERNQLQGNLAKLAILVEKLKRMQFGRKSEKRIHDPDNLLVPLFEDLFDSSSEIEEAPENTCPEKESEKQKKKRKSPVKKQQQAKDSPAVDIVEVVIPVDEENRTCTEDGQEKVLIDYETKEYWHKIPARVVLVIQKREIWGCPKSCPGQLVTAPALPHILPKAGVSPAFFSDMMANRFSDRHPWYHQSGNLERQYGITITRGTMARMAIKGAQQLDPLFRLMKETCLGYDIATLDATWFNVLKSRNGPGKRACIWGMHGGPPGKEVILFGYQRDENKKDFLKEWIGPFSGILVCDGDPDYMRLDKNSVWNLACCNSHARRYFEPLSKKVKTRGLVHDFMDLYTVIYTLEAEALEKKLDQEAHTLWRQQKMKPVFDRFLELLKEELPHVRKNSEIHKAMLYCLNRWTELTRCLSDSRIPLDTNHIERIIRKFVIGRNNWLFSDTEAGADALCFWFSLIQTARLHGLNERKYIEHLVITVPGCNPKNPEDFVPLLPWNIDKDALNKKLPSPTGWD